MSNSGFHMMSYYSLFQSKGPKPEPGLTYVSQPCIGICIV